VAVHIAICVAVGANGSLWKLIFLGSYDQVSDDLDVTPNSRREVRERAVGTSDQKEVGKIRH
jgi:hypothetical protein